MVVTVHGSTTHPGRPSRRGAVRRCIAASLAITSLVPVALVAARSSARYDVATSLSPRGPTPSADGATAATSSPTTASSTTTSTTAASTTTPSPQATAAAPATAAPPRPDPADPASYLRFDGTVPPLAPEGQFGVGFFAYGDALARITGGLGAPTEQRVEPAVIVAGDVVVSRWDLPGGAVLEVQSHPEPPHGVEMVRLTVPEGGPARVALWGGLVAGRDTLADAVRVWGPSYLEERWNGEHGAPVRYLTKFGACDGPWPMVVTFAHDLTEAEAAVTAPAEVLLREPITEVWIVWADADPYTSGCPADGPGGVPVPTS